MPEGFFHKPVMLEETLHFLIQDRSGIYIDATTGEGGHSLAIAERLDGGRLYCMDGDEEILERAKERLRMFDNVTFIPLDLSKISEIPENPSGILLDLGISSFHIEGSGRGFSFERNEPLDMRYIKDQPLTAKDVLNGLPEKELERMFRELGEVSGARKLARAIVRKRKDAPFERTVDLVETVKRVFPYQRWRKYASKVFMAIRIKVNRELERLEEALPSAFEILKPNGRLVVITYHSLEDRIVKRFFKNMAGCERASLLTKRAAKPSREEVKRNPRARSAKLRALEKLC